MNREEPAVFFRLYGFPRRVLHPNILDSGLFQVLAKQVKGLGVFSAE